MVLVEGLAAGARTNRVGVVNREALLLNGVSEVDSGAVEVRDAHAVHDYLNLLAFFTKGANGVAV